MHDDTVLVAIEAALRYPAYCACGRNLTIATRDGAAWLECAAFAKPSRLPGPVASIVRTLLHDRSFVIEVPAPDLRAPVKGALAVSAGRVGTTGE